MSAFTAGGGRTPRQKVHSLRAHGAVLAILVATGISLSAMACGGYWIDHVPSASHPQTAGLADVTLPVPFIVSDGHTADAWAVAFSADGRRLYSGGSDKVVRVWDVALGKQVGALRPPQWTQYDGAVYALDASADGKWIAFGGCQGCSGRWADEDAYLVYVADPRSLEITGTAAVAASIHALAFSADGRFLASGGSDGVLRIFRIADKGELIEEVVLPGHAASIVDIAWIGERAAIVTASRDGLLVLWGRHPAGGWFAEWKVEHEHEVTTVDATPDGRSVVAGTLDGALTLRNAADGSAVRELLKLKSAHVFSAAVASDGKSLVFGSGAGSWGETGVGVLSLPEGRTLVSRRGRESAFGLAWHQSDKGLIATTEGHLGTIALLRSRDLVEELRLQGRGGPIGAVESDQRSVSWTFWPEEKAEERIFDTESLRLRKRTERDGEFRNYGSNRIFRFNVNSPSDGYFQLVRRSNSNTIWTIPISSEPIRAWSILNDDWIALAAAREIQIVRTLSGGRKRVTCFGHESIVNGIAPHASGRMIVSSSSDQTLRFWNASTCELLLTFHPSRDGEWVAWNPLGLYAASENGASLLGFHVNRGARSTGRTYGSAQLPHLRRPDLIRKILEQGTAEGVDVTASDRKVEE